MTLQRVTVRDFQSLADVDLELGQVNVIIGPTNSGKSGLVRALEGLFYNRSGNDFIRSGATKCVVEVILDGRRITWTKSSGSGGVYEVEGLGTVSRAGNELPPQLVEITGVREIETEGVKSRLQVDGQFSPPFLLSSTGGQAAKLLAHVSKLDVLVRAQVHAKQDLGRAKKRAEEARERAEELAAKLEAMPDYEALLEAANRLQARVREQGQAYERATLALAHVDAARRADALAAVWAERNPSAKLDGQRATLDRVAIAAETVAQARVHEMAAAGLEGDVATSTAALQRMEDELAAVLKELRICPVCLRPML